MTIPDMTCSSLCVAIVANSEHQRTCLRQILEENALQVIDDDNGAGNLNTEAADVLLVNLDDSDEESLDYYLDQTTLPVLFNDSASIRMGDTPSDRAWGRRLADKLINLVNTETDSTVVIEVEDQPVLSEPSALHLVINDEISQPGESSIDKIDAIDEAAVLDKAKVVDEIEVIDEEVGELTTRDRIPDTENIPQQAFLVPEDFQEKQVDLCDANDPFLEKAEEIWVLGASIGGPDAVKRFLMSLSGSVPTAFILAQHIGSGFVSLLAEQLGKVTNINVVCAEEGHVISNNQLIIVPVDQKFGFHKNGRIKLTDEDNNSIYSPSIDDVMMTVAKQYGENTKAIFFSGMGNDGLKGAQAIFDMGGIIWAQDSGSCVISTMADSVREAGLVSETATPEKLAVNLIQSMSEEAVL